MKLEFVKPQDKFVTTGEVGDRLRLKMFIHPYTQYEFTVERIIKCDRTCQSCCGKLMIGKDMVGIDNGNNKFCSSYSSKSWAWIKIN